MTEPTEEYVMGIDEAGRGPVVGPLVYACAFCPSANLDAISKMGFNDSKVLTPEMREELFQTICSAKSGIGYYVDVSEAKSISASMLSRRKTSLNEISFASAMSLVQRFLDTGRKLDGLFVDTVGSADVYKKRLHQRFPSIRQIVVCPKADSLYPIVSAASICAKVTRDRSVEHLNAGSGYPADPQCRAYLNRALHPFFLFDDNIRFSWATIRRIETGLVVSKDYDDLSEHTLQVEDNDQDDMEEKSLTESLPDLKIKPIDVNWHVDNKENGGPTGIRGLYKRKMEDQLVAQGSGYSHMHRIFDLYNISPIA